MEVDNVFEEIEALNEFESVNYIKKNGNTIIRSRIDNNIVEDLSILRENNYYKFIYIKKIIYLVI